MSRKRRRPGRVQSNGHDMVQGIAASYACPDCLSEAALKEPAPGVFMLEVAHDDTCPWYLAHEAGKQ